VSRKMPSGTRVHRRDRDLSCSRGRSTARSVDTLDSVVTVGKAAFTVLD
jgi:hypothetical protein